MHLLKTNLNEAVLLDESFFQNDESRLNNIDYLNNVLLNCDEGFQKQTIHPIFDHEDFLQRKLAIVSRIANLVEKFHSYFHFEESYFHFVFANFLIEFYNNSQLNFFVPLEELFGQKIIDHFEFSIKQFRFNEFVHFKLVEFCKKNSYKQKFEQSIQRFESLFQKKYNEIDRFQDFKYERQFNFFENYIQFSLSCTGEYLESIKPKIQNKFSEKNFYSNFEKFSLFFLKKNSISEDVKKIAEEALKQISLAHAAYHQNAAKIYYNYSMIYKAMNQDIQSENLLRKVKNLDPTLLLR